MGKKKYRLGLYVVCFLVFSLIVLTSVKSILKSVCELTLHTQRYIRTVCVMVDCKVRWTSYLSVVFLNELCKY